MQDRNGPAARKGRIRSCTDVLATDRNFDGKHDAERNVWGCSVDSHYGTRDVSIPRDRRMGELESPSIGRLQFREDPSKDVVLLSTATRLSGTGARP
jgi:hypothetical protein